MITRKECVEGLKHSVAKVSQYDEELAVEIFNCISDYELAWRGYFGGEKMIIDHNHPNYKTRI